MKAANQEKSKVTLKQEMAKPYKTTQVMDRDHENENCRVALPVICPPSVNTRNNTIESRNSRLHNSCPHLGFVESSPRRHYHAKDNLTISFKTLQQQEFSADVLIMNNRIILPDTEYPDGQGTVDPEHRYHLKDNYVPKDAPPSPSTRAKLHSRRQSEPIPRETTTAIGIKKDSEQDRTTTLLQMKTTDSKRHLKDGFIPEIQPEYHPQSPRKNEESFFPESFKSYLTSADDPPKAEAEVEPATDLYFDEYPPTKSQQRTSPHHHKIRAVVPKKHPISAGTQYHRHRHSEPPPICDHEDGSRSPPSKNRHDIQDQHDQALPDPSGATSGTSQRPCRRQSEPKSVVMMVGSLPFLSHDRRNGDSSTVSLADSQDCASLGSLSYAAGHLITPPLPKDEQQAKQQRSKKCNEPCCKDRKETESEKRHCRRHHEPILQVDPLPDFPLLVLDDTSTRSVANSKDWISLGSLSTALVDSQNNNTETKPKRRFHHKDDPTQLPSVIVKPFPVLPLQNKVVDDSSTRSVADSQDWASLGSLSYAGHLQKPPLLEQQQQEHRFEHPRDNGRKHQSSLCHGEFNSSVPVVVASFPDLPDAAPVMDDTSTRSLVDSQDCASLGSLSYYIEVETLEKHDRNKEQPRTGEIQHSPPSLGGKLSAFKHPVIHVESPFLSKMDHLPEWQGP